MDQVLERGLVPFTVQPWWMEFIQAVQENQNAVSYLPAPSNPVPPKTLYWALNTAVELLDVGELKKKEIILDYVAGRDGGILKFFELFAHLGTSIPIGVKISALLREFVNPRNGPYKQVALKQLISLQPTLMLLDLLAEINREKGKTVDKDSIALFHAINVNTIWITSAVAKKDPKFVTAVEEANKVKFIHDLVKKNFFHPKNEVHYPCLKILRVLAKASKTGHLLGRDKFFHTLKKMMELYIATPSTKFQIVLEILVILTRNSKAQCKRFLKAGGLVALMRVFSFWPVWRGKGLAKMSKYVLNVYLQLATTYAGRRALLRSDALHNIRQFCESCPNDKQYDEVITRAFAVNSLTYGKHKLPFKHVGSPAKFEFVGRQGKGARDSGTSSDEDDPDDVEEARPRRRHGAEDDDEDDDVDSEGMISDIELDDGNEGSDDDEVTLKEDFKSVKSKVRYTNGRLDLRLITTPSNQVSAKPSSNGMTKIRSQTYTNVLPYDATNGFGNLLHNYAPFFKELDSNIKGTSPYFDEKTYESIVVGLLGRFILTEIHGAPCPKSEHKPDMTSSKSYYFEGSIPMSQLRKTYLVVSSQVRSVIPFVKVAYPEVTFGYGGKKIEFTTANTDRFTLRDKMIQLMLRTAGIGQSFKPIVVYDLDSLLHTRHQPVEPKKSSKKLSKPPINSLGNDDELKVGKFDKKKKHSLKFESRFEGGNLRKAIQVAECEYDLYLMSDVNSNRHNQWFYFQVSNTPEDTPITFNIVNCIKTNSQFNYGMQPVVFSVMDAMDMKPGWVRAGSNVMYYRNGYRNTTGKKRMYYYSATFTLTFGRKGDICYIAYHYPYSYSRLLTELWKMTKMASETRRLLVRYDMLCHSENENEVPLMTVTALNDDPRHPIELREIIFLSSRVHPGEPNSSWVMHGILHQLLFGSNMDDILKRYVFKILPMLNVEGVINGCGRCGLTDEDLNRCWKDPDPKLHPSIFHSKALIEYSCKIRNKVPTLYCDLHGHSRRKNVFFYGCSTSKSWSQEDRMKPEESNDIQVLPDAMARRSPAFQISYCKFDVRKQREATARVALWREFGITRSYTLESSYCGCDRGPYKGVSIGIGQLLEVGESLCEACVEMFDPPRCSVSLFDIPTDLDEAIKNNSKNNLINFSAEARYKNQVEAKPRIKAKKTRTTRFRAKTKKGTKKH